MNIIFITLIIILIIAILSISIVLLCKSKKIYEIKKISAVESLLSSKGFQNKEIYIINKNLTIALNNSQTRIAIVENYNPNIPIEYNYFEIPISLILKIEKNVSIKLHYSHRGETKILNIYPSNNEVKEFIHRLYELTYIKKIQTKYPYHNFTHFCASDWECSYFWAFSAYDGTFAYYKTGYNPKTNKINLKKEHFTIDTKYKYFEAPIFGEVSQLFCYDNEFLPQIQEAMLDLIKNKAGEIVKDSIYFDNHSEIIYLTNGLTSLQSAIIDKIEEVYYQDNRISFSLLDDMGTINFMSNHNQIADFENFLTNYNLKKIAVSFDYKLDKLINITPYTKFIIDFTRDRVVYCANSNRLARFSYMLISFQNLLSANIRKNGMKNFVRIETKDGETIDVSCDKQEIALYIKAQIDKITEQ